MKLKSYFSGTVEAAMELARRELGDDALLINARPAAPEARYLGAYEVVFGIPPAPSAVPEPAPVNGDFARELADLKHQFERLLIREQLDSPPAAPPPLPSAEPFEIDNTLGRTGAARAIAALVGPPGAGKTTTLAKLAVRYGLAERRPLRILSCDVFRIAAADQLGSLACILGVDCRVADSAAALETLIHETRPGELVLIDTPGLGKADMQDAGDLAGLISAHPEMDTHLVLPAFMRLADMANTISQYSVFKPAKLLFTHVDATADYRDAAAQAARSTLPISFLGTGQRIPDDLEPATRARLEPVPAERTKGATA